MCLGVLVVQVRAMMVAYTYANKRDRYIREIYDLEWS